MKTIGTVDEPRSGEGGRGAERGLVLVFAGRAPHLRAISLAAGRISIGRDEVGGAPVDDDRISRRHARASLRGDTIVVEDVGSRNGTFVDGVRLEAGVAAPLTSASVVRAGNTVLIACADIRPFLGARIEDDGAIVTGPTLARALADVGAAGASGETALLRGESGAGKENAARVFHAHARDAAAGPFVAVNCAAIPAGVAERLLFGAKRGAYSGATEDADGFCAAADGGTLFLDEVGELSLDVQAKLLRFLETHEFFPLGASKPRRVRVRVCCATHRDLREAVARGTFRGDLYYRLAGLEVRLPPLRERREEIPWLIAHAVAATGRPVDVHASLVQACLMRPWPGNVRELLSAIRRAAHVARNEPFVGAEHLDENAGMSAAIEAPSPPDIGAPRREPPPAAATAEDDGERRRYIDALQRTGGNQTRAAELLGISRRTFIRRIEELGVPRPRVGGLAS